MKFRKKPVEIEATQWFKNGDHPRDGEETFDSGQFKGERFEGKIVRYFRRPDVPGTDVCKHCQKTMHEHGWIDTLEGGHIVCPGDWIITGVKGENYPCKPDIFAATYDPVLSDAARDLLRWLGKKIETTRESAKEPYLRASRIVDGFFFGLSAPKAGQAPGKLQRVKNAISTVILAHLQRKEQEERRKREAEAARLREEQRKAEEARRAAEQARIKAEEENRKRAAATAAAKEAQAEADTSNLDARAFEAEQQAQAKPHEIASVRSAAGSLAIPKVSWDFEITDMSKVKGAPLWPYITDAAKQQAIRAYLKANAPDRLPDDQDYQPLTGVRVFRRRALQVR